MYSPSLKDVALLEVAQLSFLTFHTFVCKFGRVDKRLDAVRRKKFTDVRTGPGNLESPGILLWHFPGMESPGNGPLVLESSGNLLNSAKKYEVYGRR